MAGSEAQERSSITRHDVGLFASQIRQIPLADQRKILQDYFDRNHSLLDDRARKYLEEDLHTLSNLTDSSGN